ncbi:MAG: hypothetical protein KAT38_06540 [Bacteroidales bacterium]|nr:hypothetical protein [Bacteroidales bacterium]
MKTIKVITVIITLSALVFSGCSKDESGDSLPDNITVGISDAISFPASGSNKSAYLGVDPLTGEDIYMHLRNIIYIGELSADLVQDMMISLKKHNIKYASTFSYESIYDGKNKNVVVKENISINDTIWDYCLTVSDVELGTAFQLFWNTNPLEVIAILQPKAFDFSTTRNPNAMIKIEYSENDPDYDKTMIVSVTKIDSTSRQYMSSLKFFAGKNSDIISLYGNSTHPYMALLNENHNNGRCFCFQARNNVPKDIAIARIALPTILQTDMTNIWVDFSVDQVLSDEIDIVYPNVDQTTLTQIKDVFLAKATGPAYFTGEQGFVSNAGNVPDDEGFTQDFMNMTGLTPWAPSEINQMTITFSTDSTVVKTNYETFIN